MMPLTRLLPLIVMGCLAYLAGCDGGSTSASSAAETEGWDAVAERVEAERLKQAGGSATKASEEAAPEEAAPAALPVAQEPTPAAGETPQLSTAYGSPASGGQTDGGEAPAPVGRPLFAPEEAQPLADAKSGEGEGDEPAGQDGGASPQVVTAVEPTGADGQADGDAEPAAGAEADPPTEGVSADATAVPVRLADSSGRSPFPEAGEFITTPRAVRKVGEAPPTEAGPLKVVPWTEAQRHVGETITVEGRIVNTYNHNNSIVFLNFDEDWRDKFYIPVFDDAFPGIPGPPETYYKNKTLRITGTVTVHKGRANIEVKDAAQIKVVD